MSICKLIENNLSLVTHFIEQQKFDEAEAVLDTILTIDPNSIKAMQLYAVSLSRQEKYEESIDLTLQIIEKDEVNLESYEHLGNCYMFLKQFENTIKTFEKVLEIKPDYDAAHFYISHSCFALGEWAKGWPHYEYRINQTFFNTKQKEKAWDGKQSLQGKKIIIYCEHGLGDYIYFIRFVPKLKELGAEVLIETPESLNTLFAKFGTIINFPNAVYYDYHCSVASLPYFLNVSEFKTAPYLTSDKLDLSEYKDNFKIGIAWTGNPGAVKYNAYRSCPKEYFNTLAEMNNVKLFSLQKDVSVEGVNAISMSDHMANFTETAKIIQAMDLIVTVDTSVMHLAGALGKETWVLIAYYSDCRWTIKGNKSEWYDSITLFRQEENNNWKTPFNEIENKLKAKIQ